MAGVPDPAALGIEALVARVQALQTQVDRLEAELSRRLPRNFRVESDGSGGFRFGNDATGATAPSGV